MINEKYINKCLQWLADEVVVYYNRNRLPEELALKIDKFYDCLTSSIDWSNLTRGELTKLGFLNWGEDDKAIENDVWFIPNWLYHVIPEGIILYNKNGAPFEFHSDTAPEDVMYGCLTFGVKLNINKEENEDFT